MSFLKMGHFTKYKWGENMNNLKIVYLILR